MIDERWKDYYRRVDGLTIMAGIDGYVIMPARGLSIDKCPCCDEAFPCNAVGLRSARLVADWLYPMMAVKAEPR
jgi:hypothetical protein